jgi:hypothetical protein
MNFIGMVRVQSFVPKDSIGKFPIGFKSYKNSPFFLYSKGGLSFAIAERLKKILLGPANMPTRPVLSRSAPSLDVG